ncbi:hypothetical protein SAMN05421812_13523 [Asanoa hainanensis]|uniref:Uncharacterized protein n=1 Tax=Asanoa hainanensis TaxID=560556 RepID=A0A239PGZ4_9ACTN|nr:hypothetical protein [Asanoa hainanensis]SNT66242.1 hypothetical protein SAMN05421812_13523 [Asanoa hainanensis]
MTSHDPITYEVSTSLQLNEIAATTAQVTLHPDESHPVDITVTGPCPACDGETLHIEPVEFVRGAVAGGELDMEIICACAFPHENAPESKPGCGRSWQLTIEWDGE